MDLQQLEKLNELKEKGVISEQEFQEQKQKILSGNTGSSSTNGLNELVSDSKSYSMLMHYAQLLMFIIPLLGALVPLLMWLSRKDQDSYIDQQGKVVINWVISAFIYALVSWILVFILIGIPLLFALFVATVVFSIQGGLRAKEGVVRNYPLAIQFLKVEQTGSL